MANHIWHFARIGGKDRVCIDNGIDILNLEYLDQKLWTALSCPVQGLEIDSKTLEHIDTDKDGKIRVPEILAAIKWIKPLLKNPDDLVKQYVYLPLDAINEADEEGMKLLLSAKQILKNLGKPDSKIISVEETSDLNKIFAATSFNGDGIITTESASNPAISQVITDIISCTGAVTDRNTKDGIDQEKIELFYAECANYSAWYAIAEAKPDEILPLKNKTNEAYELYKKLKNKIDDFFIRSKFAQYDPQSQEKMNAANNKYEGLLQKNFAETIELLADFPLAQVNSEKYLVLDSPINPAWETDLALFTEITLKPLLGSVKFITEIQWISIKEKFISFENWMAEKKGVLVEKLGVNRVNEILSNCPKEALLELIAKDKANENDANYIIQVDKLVRLYRDLYTLLRNFVSFTDFYSPKHLAAFQAGTLYIDQRSTEFCIKINDVAKHSAMAFLSGVYLIYFECTAKQTKEKMLIVAGLTKGETDNLMLGRNAIFYDRKGNDWDASIVKIIENPISLWQAFWSPYRKISRLIEEQIQKFAANREKKMDESAAAGIDKTATNLTETKKVETSEKIPEPKKPTPSAFDIGKFVGIFAAIGLALGAIGTAIVAVVKGFLNLTWWQMPLSVLGLLLLISGPAMILAWLKLRKRNLAPILDANGWAINASVKVNIPFGNSLTHTSKLPANSRRTLNDPFASKRSVWWYILLVVIPLAISVAIFFLWKPEILTLIKK